MGIINLGQDDELDQGTVDLALKNTAPKEQPKQDNSSTFNNTMDTIGLVSSLKQPDQAEQPVVNQGIATPSIYNQPPPPQEQDKPNLLGKALGIVGAIYGGGAGAAVSKAGSAVNQQQSKK